MALERQNAIELAKTDASKEKKHILKLGKEASDKIKKEAETDDVVEMIFNQF